MFEYNESESDITGEAHQSDINDQEKKSTFVENKRQISTISTVNEQLDLGVLPVTSNRITPKVSPRMVQQQVEVPASDISENARTAQEASDISISEKRKMRAALLKSKIRRDSADGELAQPVSDAQSSLNAAPTPVVGKLGLLKAKSRRNTEPKEVDDNDIHFEDDIAPAPSIEKKHRKSMQKAAGQNAQYNSTENETPSSSKGRVRLTPSEMRANARHGGKVPIKLPLLSNLPKPAPIHEDPALSSRRQERSESSRDRSRSPRGREDVGGPPRKKMPLYKRMIARAFRKEQLEIMKKVRNRIDVLLFSSCFSQYEIVFCIALYDRMKSTRN